MGSQMDSLLNLIGTASGVVTKDGWKGGRDFIHDCGDNHTIRITFRRENVGANFGYDRTGYLEKGYTKADRDQFGPETPYCIGDPNMGDTSMHPEEYCPWQLDYNATTMTHGADHRILLLLNQGAHFHSVKTFSSSFDEFVKKFNTIAHPNDIVVFRSTVPGHKDCWNEFEPAIDTAEMTHDRFLERYATTKYDWNLFDEYNQYAREAMEKALTPSVVSFYLNVYNMTILRGDQHITKMDCLHYTPPGPVDFWNHLLVSNLADLAKNEEEEREIRAKTRFDSK